MQSTGTCNFCGVRSGTETGDINNYTRQKTRGKGGRYKWMVEMNTFRSLYLATYNAIDVVDHMIKHSNMEIRTRKYWMPAMLHGFALAVSCAYSMYEEVIDEHVTPAAAGVEDRAALKKMKMSFTQFKHELAVQMLQYDPKFCKYPGEKTMRQHTQCTLSRRVGLAAPQQQCTNTTADEVGVAETAEQAGAAGSSTSGDSSTPRRECMSLHEYVRDHGSDHTEYSTATCVVCGLRANSSCTTCGVPLCLMAAIPKKAKKPSELSPAELQGVRYGRDCHAQYHDALFKGLAKCDTENKRLHDGSTVKYASPSKRKIATHANTMQRQIERDQDS